MPVNNEVSADNTELLARFVNDPYMSWLMQFIEFADQEPIPEFHLDMSTDLRTEERVCYKAPRSFSKSSHVARGFPLWLACEYPRFVEMQEKGEKLPVLRPHNRILIVAGGYDLAIENLAWIKEEIELNEDLRLEYGDLIGDKWGEKLIHLSNGVRIRAVGSGARIRGYRPTMVVCDDLDDDEEVLNADIRAKNEDWFDKVIINLLDKSNAQAFVVGTDLHPLSLLNHIFKKPTWKCRIYKAFQADGTPLWPSKWPAEKLEARRKEIGSRAFNSEFMNEPIISENPIFIREWYNEYDHRGTAFAEILREGVYTILAIDPAISKKESADYTAIVTISATFGKDPKFYIRPGGVLRGHWPLNKQVTELERIYKKFSAKGVVIETVAYQQALADEFRRFMDDNRKYVNIIEIKPDKDKERRAHAVAPMLERGDVYVDLSDPMTERLVDECCLFPSGDRDDLVDAKVYALAELKQWAGRDTSSDGPNIVLPGERKNKWTGVV